MASLTGCAQDSAWGDSGAKPCPAGISPLLPFGVAQDDPASPTPVNVNRLPGVTVSLKAADDWEKPCADGFGLVQRHVSKSAFAVVSAVRATKPITPSIWGDYITRQFEKKPIPQCPGNETLERSVAKYRGFASLLTKYRGYVQYYALGHPPCTSEVFLVRKVWVEKDDEVYMLTIQAQTDDSAPRDARSGFDDRVINGLIVDVS